MIAFSSPSRDQVAAQAIIQTAFNFVTSKPLFCALARFHAPDCRALDPDHSDDNITKVIKVII